MSFWVNLARPLTPLFSPSCKASLDAEVNAGFAGMPKTGLRKLPSATGIDGLEMSLIGVGEVDRIMMFDRVVQRFTARYDAAVAPITMQVGVLLGLGHASLSNNPFFSEIFVRAFVQAWDQCAWDAQASEDLLLTLEPAHFVDLAPLYTDLNATLLQAGVQAQTVYRIKESMGWHTGSAPLGSGSMSAPAPLNEADQGMGQRAQAGSAPGGEGRSGWSGLAPAGRLDIDSTGILVLTQDGRIARQLIGEDSDMEKEYLVRVIIGNKAGPPQPNVQAQFPLEKLQRLRFGLSLDGQALKRAQVDWQNPEQLRFILKEGKKRQIRRMCEAVGLYVIGLKRVRIGGVKLGQLPLGQWRYLGGDERF